MARTRSDEAEIRLRLKDVDKLHPRSWPGSITQGLRAKSLHGCDTLIRSRRLAGEVIQLITSWTSRVTELWTDNRHEKDGTGFGLDYELAVTLSNVMEGAPKVTQTEPSPQHALVDGYAPKS